MKVVYVGPMEGAKVGCNVSGGGSECSWTCDMKNSFIGCKANFPEWVRRRQAVA